MKTTSVLKKLLVKVVDLANSFPAKAERFLYVKKQLRYRDFKKARFDGQLLYHKKMRLFKIIISQLFFNIQKPF